MSDEVIYRDKLIMIMGMQRSGTTALLYALGQDPHVQVENEEPVSPLYDQYRLRPVYEIHQKLMQIKRRVLTKPVLEADFREIEDVIREFIVYDPRVVWIYRDPVDVWSSAKNKFNLSKHDMKTWLKRWAKGNESALRAMSGPYWNRIRIVGYHDLIQHREVLTRSASSFASNPEIISSGERIPRRVIVHSLKGFGNSSNERRHR